MLVQIISDPATANWVIAIVLSIIGILLIRILNRIESTQEDHSTRIRVVETKVTVLEEKQK